MRLLMDVDGCLVDYVGGVINTIDEICGKKIARESLVNWDFLPELPLSVEEKVLFFSKLRSPGFCNALQMLPGAREGIQAVKKMGVEVIYVTSPWVSSPTWCFERGNWLVDHGFASNHAEVIHTAAKHCVAGDFMVDDNPQNVQKWEAHNQKGTGIIWRAPYNATAEGIKMGAFWELENFIRWRTVQCQTIKNRLPAA